MAVNLSPVFGAGAQLFNNDGVPLAGGLLYTYQAGTSTPQATYTNNVGNVANSNPIVMDASGRPPEEIWLTDSFAYKFVLKDANLVQIATWDNIVGINSNFQAFALQDEKQTATQGQTVFTLIGFEYQPGTNNLSVFVNGSKQISGTNYAETSTTVVTFADGLNVGDVVEFTTAVPVSTNPIDASQVTYVPSGAEAVPTNVQDKLRQFVNAQDFGVVGDGTTDDTDAFINAVNYAISENIPLNIDNLKIYLATQASSLPSDGLFIIGNGYITTYVDYTYQLGTDRFDAHKTAALTKVGSVIFSKYNGPIFTGKTFSGSGFSIFGHLQSANSSAFKQTTPTSYPGWSQAINNLTSFYVANTGNNGIWMLGGLEVCNLTDIHTFQVGQYGFRVDTTTGINSPVEYLNIDTCSFQWSYWNNIVLTGANKNITINNCLLNAPQWLSQKTANGFVITNYADIVPCVYINSPNNGAGSFTFNFTNNYAEQTNGLITFNCADGYRQQNIQITGNTMYLDQPTADSFIAQFQATVYDLFTYGNYSNNALNYYFPSSVLNANSQFLNFADEGTVYTPTIVTGGAAFSSQQLVPINKWPTSGGVGNGTAGTFTFNLPGMTTPGNNNQIIPHLYLVTANFQADSGDAVGAYLLTVWKMSSGNYVGTTLAFGSTTGFTAAPTVSTAGVVSLPLDLYYRGRVSRIDNMPLNPSYPVNFS